MLLAEREGRTSYYKDAGGFELSRRIGLAWTPKIQPVELILNGEYHGMYFLTEKINVDKNRVAITEQADGETDPEKITGGWLVEIDNFEVTETKY